MTKSDFVLVGHHRQVQRRVKLLLHRGQRQPSASFTARQRHFVCSIVFIWAEFIFKQSRPARRCAADRPGNSPLQVTTGNIAAAWTNLSPLAKAVARRVKSLMESETSDWRDVKAGMTAQCERLKNVSNDLQDRLRGGFALVVHLVYAGARLWNLYQRLLDLLNFPQCSCAEQEMRAESSFNCRSPVAVSRSCLGMPSASTAARLRGLPFRIWRGECDQTRKPKLSEVKVLTVGAQMKL